MCKHTHTGTHVPGQLSAQSTPHLHVARPPMTACHANISTVVSYVLYCRSTACVSSTDTGTQSQTRQEHVSSKSMHMTTQLHIQCERRAKPVEQALVYHNRVGYRADVTVRHTMRDTEVRKHATTHHNTTCHATATARTAT